MSDTVQNTMQNEIANMAHDINNGHVIDLHNARELAQISQYMQSNGMYNSRAEDRLAAVLKHSMQAGVYKRTSLPTPPPANIMTALRSRA